MAYTSDKWTDKELNALEKRIAEVYKQAEKDLDKEVKEYFAKFALRDKEMQKLVQSGDMTQADYNKWRLTQMGRGQRFEALRDKVAERYTKANEVANAYVNDLTPSIYSLNRNYEAYTIEKAVGSCDFTMWDESTVRRLLVEEPDLMPYYPPSKALKRGIDLAYGKEQITKHVTSGILRGLAPGKIANELMSNLTTMNRTSAVRAARTGITAAQNAGRMDSYRAAEKMGIKIKRRWICTKDARTRLSHGMADGQIVVGTKEPFKVGGYKMMFPADSSLGAPGHEIYNCRCTTRTVEKDGIEAEPREMRVTNPEWEQAKAEETKLEKRVAKLKEREQAETDPAKRKQLRKDRIAAQHELSDATKKRQGIDKDVVVNEMTYSDWKKWKETGKIPETPKPAKLVKPTFTPAKTIQEAEAFASQFVDSKGFGAIGTSYAGVHLDVANDINHALSDVFGTFDIPKLGGIAAPAKNTKLGKMVNAHAAYSPIRKSVLLDRNKSKKASTMLEGLMADKKAITNLLEHPEQYDFSKLSARLIKIIDASSATGRSIVAETVTEAITHELGHHMERSVSKADWDIIKAGMDTYAPKISGYCVDSPSEYFAESFTSYMKGEDRIDPAFRAIFDKMRK